jgi:hypothetical protein
MIEQLLAHRETIPYVLALCSIVVATTAGYLLGDKDPVDICSSYIVEAEKQTTVALDINRQLTECKAKRAGGEVLECTVVCDERVKKALNDYKEVVCSD